MQQDIPNLPPISSILLAEASAWSSLLSVQQTVVGISKQIATVDASILQERSDASTQREFAYFAALSNLLSNCDTLALEVAKLRSLRKSRKNVEDAVVAELLRDHSNESVALGTTLAREHGLSLSALSSSIRAKNNEIKTQLQQLRALLDAVKDAPRLRLGSGECVVVGIRDQNGSVKSMSVEAALAAAYARGVRTVASNPRTSAQISTLLHANLTPLALTCACARFGMFRLLLRLPRERALSEDTIAAALQDLQLGEVRASQSSGRVFAKRDKKSE
jgi:hypothetical protein